MIHFFIWKMSLLSAGKFLSANEGMGRNDGTVQSFMPLLFLCLTG